MNNYIQISYIMRGTLCSYASLFMSQVRSRRGLAAPTTWVLFLFLLGSLVGRFGIAFLGFSFILDDSLLYTEAIFRPNWANGTVSGDGSRDAALSNLTGGTF